MCSSLFSALTQTQIIGIKIIKQEREREGERNPPPPLDTKEWVKYIYLPLAAVKRLSLGEVGNPPHFLPPPQLLSNPQSYSSVVVIHIFRHLLIAAPCRDINNQCVYFRRRY